MKAVITMTAALAAIAMMGTAAAQGRHDEKPHGSAKPSASQDKERKAPPMTGGRHDERPHGMIKSREKAPADGDKADKQDKGTSAR